MKRPIYLLSLALAVAAGVAPARAQPAEREVTFQLNATTNACGAYYGLLKLNPPGIFLTNGEAVVIPHAVVTSIRDSAFAKFSPRNNLIIGVGKACTFHDCNSRKIVLTCLGAGPSQAVQFARDGVTRRK